MPPEADVRKERVMRQFLLILVVCPIVVSTADAQSLRIGDDSDIRRRERTDQISGYVDKGLSSPRRTPSALLVFIKVIVRLI